MPPKSSLKKQAVLWYFCEKCKANITNDDRNEHSKQCENTNSFVQDEILFTEHLSSKIPSDSLNDIPPRLQNNLIFLSESAMKLCKIKIGGLVSVSAVLNDGHFVQGICKQIRQVWPVPDKFLTTVFVSEQDFSLNWQQFKGHRLKIAKLINDPLPSTEIFLNLIESNVLSEKSFEELKKYLKIELKGKYFCMGAEISIKFYNKILKFKVRNIASERRNHIDILAAQIRELNLDKDENQSIFEVTHSTRISIESQKSKANETPVNELPKIRKSDLGGINSILDEIEELIEVALGLRETHPGLKISRGVLLFGPSGCGKSMICEALANGIDANLVRINPNEIFSKYFGDSEENLMRRFQLAFNAYPQPSLIIIEDINNICPKNETNDTVKRLSVAFLNILDSLHLRQDASKTFLLATTSNIENVNAAVRRSGRIEVEIEIGAPNPTARLEILQKHFSKVEHHLSEGDIKEIAQVTHGYVGSDLANLVSKAAVNVLKSENRNRLELPDIKFALNQVKPSAMREVLIESPNVRWTDIGGQEDLKLKLKQAIEWPLMYPEKFQQLGITAPGGILMFGPPGCSKTMIAKALATESCVNFLSIKGPELFSMWVGESERAVREVFRKARQVAPAIIFFDEIDAIGGERSNDGGGSSVKERVLAQMLTELDGVNVLKNVTIVAATNRPDMIDKALMRPGRIDRIVYVGLPDRDTRREIFRIKLKKMPISDDVNLEELILRTDGYSGAEIQAVCQEAALNVLEKDINSIQIGWENFEHALQLVQPRTSTEALQFYDHYLKQMQ